MGDLIVQEEGGEMAETEGSTQYLTFYAGDERFALDILEVKELVEVDSMTRVPMTPEFIRGVMNLRGSVVPVVDLASRLGRSRSELTKRSCIVMIQVDLEESSRIIGMLVDEVNEILEIAPNHVQPRPNFGTEIRTDFIEAMGEVDGEFMILLDIAHVLSVEELSALGELTVRSQDMVQEQKQDEADDEPAAPG